MLAAKRAGITNALLPELNRRDIEEIPSPARAGMRFEFLKTVDDALLLALEADGVGGFDADRPAADAIS
jgi:ATP-dependent Lon protease